MGKKHTTIDQLAEMIARGFEQTATKAEFQQISAEVNRRFDEVDKRLTLLEFWVDKDHVNRIEKLENSMRIVKAKVGVA